MQTFVYIPGKVYAPSEPEHSYQRRFLGHTKDWHVAASGEAVARHTTTAVDVFRDSEYDAARLTIDIVTPAGRASATANLTPVELRDLAQRLLDAAADIEANPALGPTGPIERTPAALAQQDSPVLA